MIPSAQDIELLLQKYAPNDEYLELVSVHGQVVAEIAVWCAQKKQLDVDFDILDAACKLHDIGSYVFIGAVNFDNSFKKNYPGHAIFGAKILQEEGLDKRIWQAVETHVLLGLSAEEIQKMQFALPHRDYLPRSLEAELLCYADRFHSKDPKFNDYHDFLDKLEKDLPIQNKRMRQFAEKFGVPDIESLSKKYNHPIG